MDISFNFSYKKRKNSELFEDLETKVGIINLQNYIPIYNKNGFNNFNDFFGALSYSIRLPNIEIADMLGLN